MLTGRKAIKHDLSLGYREHQIEIDEAIHKVLNKGNFILGEEVSAFENEFSSYLGASQGVAVASGTDALILSLKACGISSGDEVITTPFTSVANVVAIEACGATPIFIDVDESYTIDLNRLDKLLKTNYRKTIKAVMPVHLYGYTVDMNEVIALSRQYGLWVIEDCAQAHGARLNGKKVGNWGDIAGFSFYPTKNLGSFGDGGMVVTNDTCLSDKIKLLRQYGWRTRYISEIGGQNSRFDEIQAAVLRIKLKYLDNENTKRIELARIYNQHLEEIPVVRPVFCDSFRHVYHQYVIRLDRRSALIGFLADRGIAILIHYPVPIHLQPAYLAKFEAYRSLENSEKFSTEVISLPIYPQMLPEDVVFVSETIGEWAKKVS